MKLTIRTFFKIYVRLQWIRFGIRDRLLRMYHNPDTCESEEFETDFFGFRYNGNFRSFIDWSVFYYGGYEKGELEFSKKLLLGIFSPVVFDVGANVGHHSLYFSRYSNEVHSFEPFYIALSRLKEKIEINKLKNIIVNEFGLGEKNEIKNFFVPPGNNQGIGTFSENHILSDTVLQLKIINGDEYVKGANITKIDFIKIDVEGYEKYVLIGLKESISKYRPIIQMEYNSPEFGGISDVPDLKRILPDEYEIYQLILVQKYFVFETQHIKLKKLENVIGYGNILLVPVEKLKLINKFN